MHDIFYKPPRTTVTIGCLKDDYDKFKKSYPRLIGRLFGRLLKNCLKSRHFVENMLFCDIDTNGNFVDTEVLL